jgi:hypothetical protein
MKSKGFIYQIYAGINLERFLYENQIKVKDDMSLFYKITI